MADIITTNLGNTYIAEYAWGPISNGQCQIAIYDERRIPEVSVEFDSLEWIELTTEDSRVYRFEGFSLLKSITLDQKNNQRMIRIALEREVSNETD